MALAAAASLKASMRLESLVINGNRGIGGNHVERSGEIWYRRNIGVSASGIAARAYRHTVRAPARRAARRQTSNAPARAKRNKRAAVTPPASLAPGSKMK